ncbi:TPA: hypothetical protein ACPZRQ_003542 [Yersinia enterocolitica]
MTIWNMFYLAIFVFIITVYFSFKMNPSKKRTLVRVFSITIFSLIAISIYFVGNVLYGLSACPYEDNKFYDHNGVLCYGVLNANESIKSKYNISLNGFVIFDDNRVVIKGSDNQPYGAIFLKGDGIIIQPIGN